MTNRTTILAGAMNPTATLASLRYIFGIPAVLTIAIARISTNSATMEAQHA